MSELELRIVDDRANRDAARALFDAKLTQVRTDLAARGVGGRIADTAKHEATEAMAKGLEIAAESKGIIAGTLAALALWFFRGPLIEAVQGLLGDDKEPAPVQKQPDMADLTDDT